MLREKVDIDSSDGWSRKLLYRVLANQEDQADRLGGDAVGLVSRCVSVSGDDDMEVAGLIVVSRS